MVAPFATLTAAPGNTTKRLFPHADGTPNPIILDRTRRRFRFGRRSRWIEISIAERWILRERRVSVFLRSIQRPVKTLGSGKLVTYPHAAPQHAMFHLEDVERDGRSDLYSSGPYSKVMRPNCGGGSDEESAVDTIFLFHSLADGELSTVDNVSHVEKIAKTSQSPREHGAEVGSPPKSPEAQRCASVAKPANRRLRIIRANGRASCTCGPSSGDCDRGGKRL